MLFGVTGVNGSAGNFLVQSLVEFAGHIIAAVAQVAAQGCNFHQSAHVASWRDWQVEVFYFYAQDVDVFMLQSEALHFGHFAAEEVDDEVDALFLTVGFQPEEIGDIDDAQSSDFDEPAAQGWCGGNEVSAQIADADHIVCYKGRTALDQTQRYFALANAALAGDENTHAAHVDHAGMHGGAVGKFVFEDVGGAVDEVHRQQSRAEHAEIVAIRNGQDIGRHINATGKNEAGGIQAADVVQAFLSLGLGHGFQIGHFSGAEYLDALVGEVSEEPGKGKPRSVEGRLDDGARHAEGSIE